MENLQDKLSALEEKILTNIQLGINDLCRTWLTFAGLVTYFYSTIKTHLL